jgi:hypothetical protein
MAHRSRIFLGIHAAICGMAGLKTEPNRRICVCYRGTGPQDMVRPRFDRSSSVTGELSMVITSAHISPIIALIAGVLILLMPRLLNLVVAIYLICIGLIGLGVLHMLHIA